MTTSTVLRGLAVAAGALFFAATLFLLADRLNVIYTPPDIPQSANLVERLLAQIPYRQSIWPIFFATNVLLGAGFAVLVGLAVTLAARLAPTDGRRYLLLWTLATGGVLGVVGSLILVGAVQATIDIPYCDCGFKETELVSQAWAQMLIEGAVRWLINGASLLSAAGAVVAGQAFRGRGMPPAWTLLSYALGGLVVINVVAGVLGLGDASDWLTVALTGIVLPIWALWLGLRFEEDLQSSEPI